MTGRLPRGIVRPALTAAAVAAALTAGVAAGAAAGPAAGHRGAPGATLSSAGGQPALAPALQIQAQQAGARLGANLQAPHPGRPEALSHPDADHMDAGRHPAGGSPAGASSIRLDSLSVPQAVVTGNALGLDVSSYQGDVDWATARSNGASFAYMKATEGTYYTDSTYFAQQYNGSYNAGLIRGAYHFAIPSNSTGAAQADYFVAHGGGWSPDGHTLPGTLDIEYNPYGAECYGLSAPQMVAWVSSFDDEYKNLTGRLPTIYTTTGWWSACTGNASGFGQEGLALASYASSPGALPASWSRYDIWQFADQGVFPGDQDVFDGGPSSLQVFAYGTPALAGRVPLACGATGDHRTAAEASVQPGVVVASPASGATSYRTYTISGAATSTGILSPIPTSVPSSSMPLVAVWQNSTDCTGSASSRNAWATAPNGAVYGESTASGPAATNFGDASKVALVKPVVGMSPTSDANGYWLVASDGGIFSYGDARFYGSTGGLDLVRPVVGMAAAPAGTGYWMVATDGGVFAFGTARFYGSLGGLKLVRPIEAMVVTPDGQGYWMVASDGGVFCFGDATFHGSMGGHQLSAPIAGMVPNGTGYTLIGQDGRTYPFP